MLLVNEEVPDLDKTMEGVPPVTFPTQPLSLIVRYSLGFSIGEVSLGPPVLVVRNSK